MDRELIRFSKFMSLVLRHKPDAYGLALDAQGWASIEDLIAAANRAGLPLTRAIAEQAVAQNEKQRFAISEDGLRIRARQGHSVTVDLGLLPVEPPALLYHGTADRSLESIRAQGLLRGARQHVHLSPDAQTARTVGQRHGRPVILVVNSAAMHRAGHPFYRSENGVWLVDAVPVQYLQFPDEKRPD